MLNARDSPTGRVIGQVLWKLWIHLANEVSVWDVIRMPPPPLSNAHYYPAQGPVAYVPQAPSPVKSFRAGVIFTAVLALGIIIILALAGTHDQQSAGAQNVSTVAGVALLPGVAVIGQRNGRLR
jgi:hypothetical protein